ncbi:hypothetical protein H4S06_003504 [Coemansia sp. BCRC 34490]|nr:hypothetical protein H4S06_003504 [Coemansia sp. BCRC 34490]
MSQIRISYNKQSQKEFCLLEAQGSLETDQQGGLRGQQRFAEIRRAGNGSKDVVMVVGIHRLPGTVVPLAKPLAVLRKRHSPGLDDSGNNHNSSIVYGIEAIIKEKFLFKVRPDVILQSEISRLPSV